MLPDPALERSATLQRIDVLHCTDSEFAAYLALRDPAEATPTPTIAVLTPDATSKTPTQPGIWPGIVLSAPRSSEQPQDHLDAMAIDGVADVDDLIAAITANPQAATALALHQRDAANRSVSAGLIAESTTYSMLLASHEFAAWRAANPPRHRPELDKPISSFHRTWTALDIELNRAEKRNAINARLRDCLLSMFDLAAGRDDVEIVTVTGAGQVFCSGGDLDEFGTFDDPTSAHHLRLGLSLGAKIESLSNWVIVKMHGACRGSGIELAAFAHTIIAHPNTTFALPEVAMGLIPGAGGTVSISRRIGRLRTTTWALSGAVIDAPRALEWGLIDVVDSWRCVMPHPG